MKEIIIATGTLGGGGAERVFLNIANEVATRGYKVTVLVTGSRPAQSYPLVDGVKVDKISSTRTNKVFKIFDKILKFRKYFKMHRGATIISFFPDVSAYCVLASLGINVKNVVSERNDPNIIPRKKHMKWFRNWAFRHADCCVFQTEDAMNYFSEKVRAKGYIIPNPINVVDLPDSKPINERDKVILAVGRIVPQKNFMMLVKAWQRICAEFPEHELHIFGDKTYRDGIFADELQEYIDSNCLSTKVYLKGFSDKIYDIMNSAEIYASSSDFEGMSNTMLEAMAIGTPTVATDCPIGGARIIIKNGENGLITTVNNEIEMSEKLKLLLSDYSLRQKLSEGGKQLRESLSVQRVCDMWVKLL